MDVFCMAGVHQQAELSNYLAEGQIQTCKLQVALALQTVFEDHLPVMIRLPILSCTTNSATNFRHRLPFGWRWPATVADFV